INDAAQKALERFDESMRDLALLRYREFEKELAPILTRHVVAETVRRFGQAGDLDWQAGQDETATIDLLTKELTREFGAWLAKTPALEDVARMTQLTAQHIANVRAFRSWYQLTDERLANLKKQDIPDATLQGLRKLKDQKFTTQEAYRKALGT